MSELDPYTTATTGCSLHPAATDEERKSMQRLRQIVSGVAIGAMVLSQGVAAWAQTTPEAAAPDPRAQLAAVTPGVEDLPTGFAFVGETFLSADQVSGPGLDAAALQDSGFVTQYVSVYENTDSKERIRSYASLWADDASAGSGFAVLEDEAATNPDATLEDGGTEVGEEPRETSTGTYLAADGATIGTADVTFRRGPMVVGVAHEKLDGSAADTAIATDIATRVDERAQAVLNGESPAHTDLALPAQVLSFAGNGNATLQAGFLGPVEVESIYGVQGSLLSGVNASWVETTMIGSSEPGAPTVTVGVTTFGTEDNARSTAEQAADLFLPLANQEVVDGVTVEGADAASAFRYSSESAEDGALDSYRLIFATGTMLTVIDLQGSASDGGAEQAATAISTAQMTCQAGEGCEAPALPAEFTGQ
jgi:hypothetical protein